MAITAANRKWWVVAAMSMTLFLLAADNFGVVIILPPMSRDLHASAATSNWFFNAFLLSFAAFQLPIGRLADLIGRRKVLITGTVVFGIASAMCGMAPTSGFLIMARVIEGCGAAMIYATSLSLVSNAFPVQERGTGIGLWTAIGLIGGAVGPFLGGLLNDLVSWRLFFFINVPLSVLAVVLTLYAVPESRDESAKGRIDWGGFALITIGLVAFIYGINQSAASGWLAPIVYVTSFVGIAVIGGFVYFESRLVNPLVDISLFASRNFLSASIVAFIGNYCFAVTCVFIAQYLQSEAVINMSPLLSGVEYLAFSVPIVLLSIVTGKTIARFGMRNPMAWGSAGISASYIVLLFADAGNGVWVVLIALVVSGFGQALAYNISTTAALNEIPDEKAGVASGMIAAIRLVGMMCGVAFTSSLLKEFESAKLLSFFRKAGVDFTAAEKLEVRGLLSGSQQAVEHLTKLTPVVKEQVQLAVRDAFTSALHRAMFVTFIVSLISIAGALWYKDRATVSESV